MLVVEVLFEYRNRFRGNLDLEVVISNYTHFDSLKIIYTAVVM